LERAQQLFPHAAFMLMLDAEWYLKNGSSLIDFCHICLARNDMYTSYVIRIFNETFDFYVPRLIRCNSNVQFEGVVHEIIRSQTRVKVPSNIYFEYLPTMQGIEKTYDRYQKDKKLLHQEYVKNPSNTRTLFYLAMTCQALGHLEEAYNFYKKRADFVTFDEEYFMSYYKLAQVIEKLSYNNTSYKWDEALNYYLKAYEMRSHRIEPLISIAQYYIAHNDIEKALPFVQCAIEIPYPQEDMLFVEKHMYDYVRHRLLKRCEPFIIK
jgi:tetratricopeptide (TPR) repeat protein